FLKACGAIKAHESRFACYRHFTGENAPILSFNKRPPAGLSDLGVSAETTQSVQDLEGRCTSEHRFEIFMYGNIAKCVETGLISLVKIKGAAYVDNHESGDKVPLSGSRDKKILSLPAPDQHAPPANPKSDAQIGK
ncbi:MAG: hypothetical protein ACXWP5_11480, partial [Bdellovibrionota bacterium]